MTTEGSARQTQRANVLRRQGLCYAREQVEQVLVCAGLAESALGEQQDTGN